MQGSYRNTFVTYDTILGCVYTTLVAFLDDPFRVQWEADEPYRGLSSYVYNRNPNVYAPGTVGAITLLRPASGVGADSLYITDILGDEGPYCTRGEWICSNSFYGAFVGTDTIRGVFQLFGCGDRGSGDPFPEEFRARVPMTFVRVN